MATHNTQLLGAIRAAQLPDGMVTRVVAIVGCGGAGKSTLAGALSTALDDAPIVPTDDYASWDNPLDWWPRLIEEVLEPLARGDAVRYQRYDWMTRMMAEEVALPPRPKLLILEGVSAMRREFDRYLAYRVWVDAPSDLRLKRGLERDGDDMRPRWLEWMAAENAYIDRDHPAERADARVSGKE